jgi:DNA-binding response OmpR family regulator
VVGDADHAAVTKQVILVVEDTRPIADVICQMLNEQPHYEAIAVGDGAAALETLRGVRVSLLILDVGLPGISGEELYDRLQAEEATRALPVLFVSADGRAIARLRARPVPYVLQKPFELDELLHRVETALAGVP